MKDSFSYYVQLFFKDYLPVIRNFSPNTISTYKYAFLNLIKYLKVKNINVDDLIITDLSYELIEEFIKWLKDIKKLNERTINVILAGIKSFLNYLLMSKLY